MLLAVSTIGAYHPHDMC